jgi:hypothetical protein
LTQIHLRFKSALSSDNNFLTQAAWMMAGGHSPAAEEFEPVYATEVYKLLERARERLRNPKPIPRWCCDGTHSAGDDARFMGVWFHMYAACLAFERYGRLDPEDQWTPDFYCYDGLEISAERSFGSGDGGHAVLHSGKFIVLSFSASLRHWLRKRGCRRKNAIRMC